MNKKVQAVVETPIGKTERFKLNEIVKQGTVNAVDLCGVSTDRINKLEEKGPKLTVSNVEIKYPVYVDDMLGMGTKEMIEDMEPKMKCLEETKKFTFNNDKGKSEIMQIEMAKKNKNKKMEKRPIVRVKRGVIGYTEKYKYIGDQYDSTGKNMGKIVGIIR